MVDSDESRKGYDQIPRSEGAQADDSKIIKVEEWLKDPKPIDHMSESESKAFIRYAMQFFVSGERLWKKNPHGEHQLVVRPEMRMLVLRQVHDSLGHHRFYATRAALLQRFWWPHVHRDIVWYVRTCDICQRYQTQKVLIPPVVATPAPLFSKMYADTMHLPASNQYRYLVQGRCSLTQWPEFRKLRRETGQAIGDWLFEDVLCRWGTLSEIVTDNGAPFVKAMDYLSKRYHINHIRISGYNSRANGLVERPHFDVRQALIKAADGEESKWSQVCYSVFWAERITVRRRMGCSPYYAATGTHPLLPLDITEATYLQPPPDSVLSTTDLIARRAIALQKRDSDLERLHSIVFEARRRAAVRFEREHIRTVKDFKFKRGALVLIRNTQIEKALNRKMRPRYFGPNIVISRNKGGAYIVCELDGSVFDRPIAAFRLIPYFARKSISIPDNFIDIDEKRLEVMEGRDVVDDVEQDNESDNDGEEVDDEE
jgi:hypothetical protein